MGTVATIRQDIGNLPLELTSFVDRETQLSEAKGRLATSRLVTLIGMGGVGKTRLAIRVGSGVRPEFEDGVWLVQLDLLQDPALVPQTVAATLGLREQSRKAPLETLADYLGDRQLLLLLDNCEHLLEATAALAMTLLQRCPDVQILATSREPLGVQGEALVSVPPLAVPDEKARESLAEVARYNAVTLFSARATAAVPGFRLGNDNYVAAAEIVRRLDGLPLAIELVAAGLRAFTIDDIARRLAAVPRLPSTRPRGVPARHQTLQASLDWSYDLCSPEERLLWVRLAVFRGGFDLDAAEAVCAEDGLKAEAVVGLVAALVDKSIVIKERADSFARYRLLETIRDFGWAKLVETGELTMLRRRHRDWYDRWLQQVDGNWIGPRQVEWVKRIEREMPNLQTSMEFSLSEPGQAGVALAMAGKLADDYWLVRGPLSEGRHWLERSLAHDVGRGPDRNRALFMGVVLAGLQGDLAAASRFVEYAQGRSESADAFAKIGAGALALWTDDLQRAAELFQDGAEQFRVIGDVRFELEALTFLAPSLMLPDEAGAAATLEKILAIAEPRGELFHRSLALSYLGMQAWRQGNFERAVTLLREGLASISKAMTALSARSFLLWEVWSVEALAWTSASRRDYRRGAILLGVAQAVADHMGIPTTVPGYLMRYHQACEQQVRAALGEDGFESEFEHGLAMSTDDAIAYAAEPRSELPAPPSSSVQSQPSRAVPSTDAAVAAESPRKPVIRVVIVHPHRIVADGLQLVLTQHPDLQVVGIGANAGDAVALTSSTRPDVVLADYQLPDATGVELATMLRKDQPTVRVLLLSSVVSNALLQEAVRAGARGFLLKTQPAEQLVDAVRRAAAGEVLIPAVRLAGFLAGSEKDAQLFDLLTGREREVLRLLAAGLDNRHIAARMKIGYVTVRSHLRNLSSKLDAHSKVEILARASELGLIVR